MRIDTDRTVRRGTGQSLLSPCSFDSINPRAWRNICTDYRSGRYRRDTNAKKELHLLQSRLVLNACLDQQ